MSSFPKHVLLSEIMCSFPKARDLQLFCTKDSTVAQKRLRLSSLLYISWPSSTVLVFRAFENRKKRSRKTSKTILAVAIDVPEVSFLAVVVTAD